MSWKTKIWDNVAEGGRVYGCVGGELEGDVCLRRHKIVIKYNILNMFGQVNYSTTDELQKCDIAHSKLSNMYICNN